MPDSQDTAIYEAVPLSDYINCTTMAKETLVCRSPTISDSLSHQTSKFTKSVKSTKNKNLSSTGIQSMKLLEHLLLELLCEASTNKIFVSDDCESRQIDLSKDDPRDQIVST
jgi:hypothetical protein